MIARLSESHLSEIHQYYRGWDTYCLFGSVSVQRDYWSNTIRICPNRWLSTMLYLRLPPELARLVRGKFTDLQPSDKDLLRRIINFFVIDFNKGASLGPYNRTYTYGAIRVRKKLAENKFSGVLDESYSKLISSCERRVIK